MKHIKFAPDGAGGGSDGSPVDESKKTYTAEEVEKIRADAKEAYDKRDKATEAKRVAEAALAEKERLEKEAKATTDGNIEALRSSFTERETKLKAEKDEADKKLEKAILKSEVVSVLAEVSTDPDLAFMYLKDEFEVKPDEHGEMRARPIKDSSSVKNFILKKLASKPYLLKNDRAAGLGTQQASEGAKSALTKADLERMSPDDRQYAYAKNPELRKLAT